MCRDRADAVSALMPLDDQRVMTAARPVEPSSVVFMFPGQGAQYVGMGRDLYAAEPDFRQALDVCCDGLAAHLGCDLRELLYPRDGDVEAAGQRLRQTAITQPALFAIEYALARLWMAWGVRPAAMIGHSIGEYVAACLAGVLSLEDALSVVAARGRLLQELPTGSMLAVPLSEADLRPYLNRELSLAAVDAPARCVVSGTDEAIAQLAEHLTAQGVQSRRLQTSHAFHSHLLDPVLSSFTHVMRGVTLQAPQIPYVSNVTDTWIQAEQAMDPAYWAQHLRQTVQFAAGVDTLLQERRLVLEVGPGQVLSTLVRQRRQREAEVAILTSLRQPQEGRAEVADVLQTLGQAWLAGAPVDWSGFYAHERRQRLPLPTYPFERQRYWLTQVAGASLFTQPETAGRGADALQKCPDVADWFYMPSWQRT